MVCISSDVDITDNIAFISMTPHLSRLRCVKIPFVSCFVPECPERHRRLRYSRHEFLTSNVMANDMEVLVSLESNSNNHF